MRGITPEPAYAHSRLGEPEDSWELLPAHLCQVADLAANFAAAFQSADWGYIAGLWHDLGKYRPEFQRRLRGSGEQAPHASVGAARAHEARLPPAAFAIAGHHAGLANFVEQLDTKQLPLRQRVAEGVELLQSLRSLIPPEIAGGRPAPALPSFLSRERDGGEPRQTELWIRFLFSALVDADRLATEAFYEPGKRANLRGYDDLPTLRARLDERLSRFSCLTAVDALRARVLEQCRSAATMAPGIFSLSVPTGGGKTLSSLAFALAHAERYGLRRVISVIPYTSIIEQTAEVYRRALGEHNVIEHHSAIDETVHRGDGELEVRRRLAAENWDAPVIVTTSVQFFESLFSNEPARCRKLHNVARSIVLIDEAQTLPTRFLLCLIDGMRELARAYGCSLVLSTATQPALTQRPALPQGLTGVREIMNDPDELARALDRVEVRWPDPSGVTRPFDDVAAEMNEHPRVLAIVHRRRDARVLADLLPPEGCFHLSTRMCAAHRAATLAEIRGALFRGAHCRVVSTQLVEAGVDIDFPVVFRALAGLDSLAQAAGRCNRNGLLADACGAPARGAFVVFRADTLPPAGTLRKGLEVTEAMLASRGGALDLRDRQTMDEYFRRLYLSSDPDEAGVMPNRVRFNFATVGQLVRFIDDGATHPVVVPWGDPEEVGDRIRRFEGHPSRDAARALQPYVVQVREHELRSMEASGAVVEVPGFGYALASTHHRAYDRRYGLSLDDPGDPDPDALII